MVYFHSDGFLLGASGRADLALGALVVSNGPSRERVSTPSPQDVSKIMDSGECRLLGCNAV
jgi:hypothetical protein